MYVGAALPLPFSHQNWKLFRKLIGLLYFFGLDREATSIVDDVQSQICRVEGAQRMACGPRNSELEYTRL
jgi:hypothetical protein